MREFYQQIPLQPVYINDAIVKVHLVLVSVRSRGLGLGLEILSCLHSVAHARFRAPVRTSAHALILHRRSSCSIVSVSARDFFYRTDSPYVAAHNAFSHDRLTTANIPSVVSHQTHPPQSYLSIFEH